MPDDKPQTPAEQQAINAEQRADYRNARLRDQFGEWFKTFSPEPGSPPESPPSRNRGRER